MNDSIFRSLEMIENRISEKLTVEHIASGVYFSKYHYGRLFRETVGESVMEYVTKRKHTLAGRALLETDSAILDIALRFGFDSHEGFTRSFKAYMGVTPTDYRKYSLASISQKTVKERASMMYSASTDGIIRELNEWIVKAKDLAAYVRKNGAQGYEAFWNTIADDVDSFADKTKPVIERIGAISEHPDEITNRFAILKAVEDMAFDTNVMALHVRITAIGRAIPEQAKIHAPLCDRFVELARMSGMKAGRVAAFLGELAELILDDMRKATGRKIQDAIEKGKEAVEGIEGYALYIKEELRYLVNELSGVPVEEVTVSLLEDYLFKMRILSLAAKVDVLQLPASKPMFEGMFAFMDSLADAADFCRTIVKPEQNLPLQTNTGKHFIDIAYQSNILRFYTKGEVEKLGARESGGFLSGEQIAAFDAIGGSIDAYIHIALGATDASAYGDIANRIRSVAADLTAQADGLSPQGGAIRVLAEEFGHLGDAVTRCVK